MSRYYTVTTAAVSRSDLSHIGKFSRVSLSTQIIIEMGTVSFNHPHFDPQHETPRSSCCHNATKTQSSTTSSTMASTAAEKTLLTMDPRDPQAVYNLTCGIYELSKEPSTAKELERLRTEHGYYPNMTYDEQITWLKNREVMRKTFHKWMEEHLRQIMVRTARSKHVTNGNGSLVGNYKELLNAYILPYDKEHLPPTEIVDKFYEILYGYFEKRDHYNELIEQDLLKHFNLKYHDIDDLDTEAHLKRGNGSKRKTGFAMYVPKVKSDMMRKWNARVSTKGHGVTINKKLSSEEVKKNQTVDGIGSCKRRRFRKPVIRRHGKLVDLTAEAEDSESDRPTKRLKKSMPYGRSGNGSMMLSEKNLVMLLEQIQGGGKTPKQAISALMARDRSFSNDESIGTFEQSDEEQQDEIPDGKISKNSRRRSEVDRKTRSGTKERQADDQGDRLPKKENNHLKTELQDINQKFAALTRKVDMLMKHPDFAAGSNTGGIKQKKASQVKRRTNKVGSGRSLPIRHVAAVTPNGNPMQTVDNSTSKSTNRTHPVTQSKKMGGTLPHLVTTPPHSVAASHEELSRSSESDREAAVPIAELAVMSPPLSPQNGRTSPLGPPHLVNQKASGFSHTVAFEDIVTDSVAQRPHSATTAAALISSINTASAAKLKCSKTDPVRRKVDHMRQKPLSVERLTRLARGYTKPMDLGQTGVGLQDPDILLEELTPPDVEDVSLSGDTLQSHPLLSQEEEAQINKELEQIMAAVDGKSPHTATTPVDELSHSDSTLTEWEEGFEQKEGNSSPVPNTIMDHSATRPEESTVKEPAESYNATGKQKQAKENLSEDPHTIEENPQTVDHSVDDTATSTEKKDEDAASHSVDDTAKNPHSVDDTATPGKILKSAFKSKGKKSTHHVVFGESVTHAVPSGKKKSCMARYHAQQNCNGHYHSLVEWDECKHDNYETGVSYKKEEALSYWEANGLYAGMKCAECNKKMVAHKKNVAADEVKIRAAFICNNRNHPDEDKQCLHALCCSCFNTKMLTMPATSGLRRSRRHQ